VAKVLHFCGPPLKMKRGLMIPKHLKRMNEIVTSINLWCVSLISDRLGWPRLCMFPVWWRGIVLELRLVIDTWHSSRTWYLLFGDEHRWGTAPDLTCVHMVMMLGGWLLIWRLFGETEFKEYYWGCFESSCVHGCRELWPRSIYKNNMKMQCNLTFNATLNTKT
jgi:hypothetical protein